MQFWTLQHLSLLLTFPSCFCVREVVDCLIYSEKCLSVSWYCPPAASNVSQASRSQRRGKQGQLKDVAYGPVQLSHNKSRLKVKANATERLTLPTLWPRILKDLFPTKSASMSWKFYVWDGVIEDNNLTHVRLERPFLSAVTLFIPHHYSERNLVSALLSAAYIGSCLLR